MTSANINSKYIPIPTESEWDEAHQGRLDRVGVLRLLAKLKRDITLAANSYAFEFNDELTRASVVKTVSSYLAAIKQRHGCEDFAVVCDETNNPPDAVDQGQLNVDVLIKPKCGVGFIKLEVKTAHEDFCQPENRSDRAKPPPIIISMIRQIMPDLIAADLCSVQPMTGPVGEIFVVKPKYTPRWNGMITPMLPTQQAQRPGSMFNLPARIDELAKTPLQRWAPPAGFNRGTRHD